MCEGGAYLAQLSKLDTTFVAGFIQAIATLVSAVIIACVAFKGLGTWRREQIGKRVIDRAEACLVAAHEVVDLIRASRSSLILDPKEDASMPESLTVAANAIRDESLARAWASWKTFAAEYRRAGFFIELPEEDAAREIAAVLTELSGLARLIATYERHEENTTSYGSGFKQQLADSRAKFLGDTPEGKQASKDPLEIRLTKALASLEAMLLPQLRAAVNSK